MSDRYRIRHFFAPNEPGYGGYTTVVDMEAKVVGIAVCSIRDQFARKKGVAIAKERIQAYLDVGSSTFSEECAAVIGPRVHGEGRYLARNALYHAGAFIFDHFPEVHIIQTVIEVPRVNEKVKWIDAG
jgi:hypothetical protein